MSHPSPLCYRIIEDTSSFPKPVSNLHVRDSKAFMPRQCAFFGLTQRLLAQSLVGLGDIFYDRVEPRN